MSVSGYRSFTRGVLIDYMDVIALIDLVAKYGIWVVFAGGWWLERGERKELQKEKDVLAEKVFTAMREGTDALKELRYAIRGERRD